MKQLFLLIMSVVMIYGCSDSGTDDNPSLKSNSVVTKIYLSTYNLDFETKGGKNLLLSNLPMTFHRKNLKHNGNWLEMNRGVLPPKRVEKMGMKLPLL